MSSRVAVVGAGAWGTALAIHAARCGLEASLWSRDARHAEDLARHRENRRHLAGAALPASVRVLADLRRALEGADLALVAVPAAATREAARAARPLLARDATLVSTAKGLDPSTSRRLSQVIAEEIGEGRPVAVLSGPSFAAEVAAGQPTAVVVASHDLDVAREVQAALSGPSLRAYASQDVAGVELCGALKNVVAIAAGLAAGLGLGANSLAALVTRGLFELGSLACALGAQPGTVSGLAGLGDLVLTCTGAQSRNRRLGEAVARGAALDEALAGLGHVAEGALTTRVALGLARGHGIAVPITEAVDDVLSGRLDAKEAIAALMGRALRDESP